MTEPDSRQQLLAEFTRVKLAGRKTDDGYVFRSNEKAAEWALLVVLANRSLVERVLAAGFLPESELE